jgi:hypothetical protein
MRARWADAIIREYSEPGDGRQVLYQVKRFLAVSSTSRDSTACGSFFRRADYGLNLKCQRNISSV